MQYEKHKVNESEVHRYISGVQGVGRGVGV